MDVGCKMVSTTTQDVMSLFMKVVAGMREAAQTPRHSLCPPKATELWEIPTNLVLTTFPSEWRLHMTKLRLIASTSLALPWKRSWIYTQRWQGGHCYHLSGASSWVIQTATTMLVTRVWPPALCFLVMDWGAVNPQRETFWRSFSYIAHQKAHVVGSGVFLSKIRSVFFDFYCWKPERSFTIVLAQPQQG